jgi:uncharacterized iron-regulated membrane protein
VHRWVGLLVAVFLFVAGTTGSLLAFWTDLDLLLNPELLRSDPPWPGSQPLDALELRDRVQRQLPQGFQLDTAMLAREPGRSVEYWIEGRQTFVDPYSGRIIGSREFGKITEGKKNLVTFVYRLHYSLALGRVGTWLFGIVALLWSIDCFVGAYLTLPARRSPRRSPGQWVGRWLPSWTVRARRTFALIFTWHRASGLWAWAALLVFAWSAVALNLGEQVYQPVMSLLWPGRPDREPPALTAPRIAPRVGFSAARQRARTLLAEQSASQGFRVIGERALTYQAASGVYRYTVESTLDIDRRLADTTLVFDGDDGRLLAFHAPTGESARETFDRWLLAFHFGAIRPLGSVYRAVVSAVGVAVATLSVTGVWIWWRRRKRSRRHRSRPGTVKTAP